MMYNPGSPDAIRQGCTCPALDNNHGEGFSYRGRTQHWINEGCPLHDPAQAQAELELGWGSDVNATTGERMANVNGGLNYIEC